MATVRTPSSLHAQIMRSAISPRFATRIFLNIRFRIRNKKARFARLQIDTGLSSGPLSQTIPVHTRSAARSPPASSRSRRPHPTRFHSSTSSLPLCTAPVPVPQHPQLLRTEARPAMALHKTCRRSGIAQYAASPPVRVELWAPLEALKQAGPATTLLHQQPTGSQARKNSVDPAPYAPVRLPAVYAL